MTNFCTLTCVAIESVLVPNTHFCLLLKNGKKVLDNKGYGGAMLMGLLKAFETINHDL